MSDCIGFKRAETHSEKHRSVQLQLLDPTYSPLQSTALHSRRKNQAPPPHTAASHLHILPLTHSSIHPSIQNTPPKRKEKSSPDHIRPDTYKGACEQPVLTPTTRRTMIMMSLLFLCILEKREKKPPPLPGQGWNFSFFFFLLFSGS